MNLPSSGKEFFSFVGADNPLADTIMDRITYDSYKIDIENVYPTKDESMRKRYGLDPAKAR